jgi:hypothetical protein
VTSEQIVPPEFVSRFSDAKTQAVGSEFTAASNRSTSMPTARGGDNASLTILRSVKVAPINALFDPDRASVCRDIATLMRKDLAGTQSRKNGKMQDHLFP